MAGQNQWETWKTSGANIQNRGFGRNTQGIKKCLQTRGKKEHSILKSAFTSSPANWQIDKQRIYPLPPNEKPSLYCGSVLAWKDVGSLIAWRNSSPTRQTHPRSWAFLRQSKATGPEGQGDPSPGNLGAPWWWLSKCGQRSRDRGNKTEGILIREGETSQQAHRNCQKPTGEAKMLTSQVRTSRNFDKYHF